MRESEECKTCKVLERELEIVRTEKNELQEILFRRVGLIQQEEEIASTEFKSIHKHVSLSKLRTELEARQRSIARKPALDNLVANPAELTEAERKFQDSLNEARKNEEVH